MLTKLSLSGFKRYREPTEFKLAPITLLLGSNSAGKSSVMQAINVCRQTFEQGPTGFMNCKTEGRHAALGRFGNVQNVHDPETTIEIGFEWMNAKCMLQYADPNSNQRVLDGKLSATNELCGLQLRADEHTLTMEDWSLAEVEGHGNKQLKFRDGHKRLIPIEWFPDQRAYSILGDVGGEDTRSVIKRSLDRLGLLLHETRHIGPTRIKGQRFYELDSFDDDVIGHDGAALGASLLRGNRMEMVGSIFERFGVPYSLTFRWLETLGNTVDLRLIDHSDFSTEVGIGDVGFGISQLLPIVTEWAGFIERNPVDKILFNKRLFMLEQPELHLHPRWQVELMRMFARPFSRMTDSQLPTGVQIIIETHSKTIVRAFQQLVRVGYLTKDQVSILSFELENNAYTPRVRRIELDEEGYFRSRWPKGFFSEEDDLMLEGYSDEGK